PYPTKPNRMLFAAGRARGRAMSALRRLREGRANRRESAQICRLECPMSTPSHDASPDAPLVSLPNCGNCGTPMQGDFCYRCCQPVRGLVRHFSSIVGDFFDTVFELDSRMARTLGPLLIRPGWLTLRYFEGQRVRYVSPV